MGDWRYVSLVALLVVVVGTVVAIQYYSSPLTGEVWLMVSEDERLPTVQAYELPSLTKVEFPYGDEVEIATVVQKTLMFNAARSPDGAVAYLSKSKGRWQVFVDDEPLSNTPTLKRDLSWAPDGLSLAYSEINASSTAAERQSPDSWSVVRLLRSGDSIVVGHGIQPQALAGAETAALTTRGIVSLRFGEESVLLIASPTTIHNAPIAVAPGGERIAWISPADHSLQVFMRTPANTYEPMLLKPAFQASSLIFSPDGESLLASRTSDAGTVLVHVTLPVGRETVTDTLPTFATLSYWQQK